MSPALFQSWLLSPQRRPLIMGVLNITPDSFSDGGLFLDPAAALAQAHRLISQGADILDIGGESTRPGSQPVSPPEQIRRVVPVIHAIRSALDITLSIDTTRAQVAQAALHAGASIVNDISAGRHDPDLLPAVARAHAPIILMHMLGQPATMQVDPTYEDVAAEVESFLRQRLQAAADAGIDSHNVLLDPGIGFGKNVQHNLQLLHRLPALRAIGRPVVIGTSRKGFIGQLTAQPDPARRIFGTAATVAWSIANGADIVRVHDVDPITQTVKVIRAIQTESTADFLKD